MVTIQAVRPADVADVVATLVAAFATDPLMAYFFGAEPARRQARVAAFCSMLLRARIALGMPALVAWTGDSIAGAAMGYDTSHPDWPVAITDEWNRFEAAIPGLAERFAAYDQVSQAHLPGESYYYLGVIGVHPAHQGQGVGRALLDAFCARSQADPASGGVYLETGSRASLDFYRRNGFSIRGEGRLDDTPLWCVYRPT